MTNRDDINDQVYEELPAAFTPVHKADQLIILGDFNA